MKGTRLNLSSQWTVGGLLGSGGCGRVYELAGGDQPAVAKFVPKAPGADRELLFIELDNVRNVVPIIDSGEYRDDWVLIMPRAERSLRQHLIDSGGVLDLDEVLAVLSDVATALVDLEGKVVHRDLKPENVLLLSGSWCLADFGISRYAEASTAPDTHKWAMSPPYAAPERWRSERATSAADVYALGVMGFEMIKGHRPFTASSVEDYRDLHLEAAPAAKLAYDRNMGTARRLGWSIKLGDASITLTDCPGRAASWGTWQPPAFTVDLWGTLAVRIPRNNHDYEGRAHSLWFGDIQAAGQFGWYETSFMFSGLSRRGSTVEPFSLDPGAEAAKAVWSGMAEYQLAWPFTKLEPGNLDEFIERWVGWFGAAASGRLTHPSTMPERTTQNSWRRG